jgi:hypothetical protein
MYSPTPPASITCCDVEASYSSKLTVLRSSDEMHLSQREVTGLHKLHEKLFGNHTNTALLYTLHFTHYSLDIFTLITKFLAVKN